MHAKIMLLAFVVLVAGCTSTQQTDTNNGLVITEFSVSPSELLENRDFSILMQVENVGDTTATDVTATLSGLPFKSDGNPGVDPQLTKDVGTKTLRPPDTFTNQPGEVALVNWNWKTPDLPEGLSNTYDITGRVTYTYATSAGVTLQVYNEDEFARRKILGQELSDPIVVTNTNAPVKVDVEGVSPIVVRKDAQGSYSTTDKQKIFLRLRFSNVGDGIPLMGSLSALSQTTNNRNDRTINNRGSDIIGLVIGLIELQGNAMFDPKGCLVNKNKYVALTGPEFYGEPESSIIIREGDSTLVPCTIEITPSEWQNKPQDTLNLLFDLRYKYFVEKTDTLFVQSP